MDLVIDTLQKDIWVMSNRFANKEFSGTVFNEDKSSTFHKPDSNDTAVVDKT
jgi:hypothetical protein